MSEGRIEVVRLGAIEPHTNADALDVTLVHGGYPCIVRRGEFRPGDLAVYVPIDSVVPDAPQWSFLQGHRRIRAKRLRGTFSMGLLVPAEADMAEGDDVGERLGIVRYEPPEEALAGADNERDPVWCPVYDIEGLRRWPSVLEAGEMVHVTEKVHGSNGRFCVRGRLYCGSRTGWKREDDRSIWWKAARQAGLAKRLAPWPDLVFYGEVFGQVQDMKYDRTGVDLAFFDAFNVVQGRWMDVEELHQVCGQAGLALVPQLFWGPWNPASGARWAEGQSLLANHVREGFVVRPLIERQHPELGRVILKMHGEGYLTRKAK